MRETKLTLARIFLAAAIGSLVGVVFAADGPRVPAYAAALTVREHSLPIVNQALTRYLWCPEGSREEHVAAALLINFAVNQSSSEWVLRYPNGPIRGNVVADGALIEVDFRTLGDTQDEILRQLEVWDSLVTQDPYFAINVRRHKVDCKPYKADNGKTYSYRWEAARHGCAEHLGIEAFQVGLVYDLRWMVVKSLTTLDGGAYYKFRGIVPVGKDGTVPANVTTLDAYKKRIGVSKSGTTKDRAGLVRKLNKKPAGIDLRLANELRPTAGNGLYAQTDDLRNGSIDPFKDPFSNLLDNNPDGHETFAPLENGWIEFGAWNGKGQAVASVPDDIAVDNNKPKNTDCILQPGISCIDCHGPQTMWNAYRNEVHYSLAQTNIFTDFSKGFGINDQFRSLREIAAQYRATEIEINMRLQDARNSFDRRVSAVTGGIRAAQAIGWLVEIYNKYEYDPITPSVACEEVGIVPKVDPRQGDIPAGVATFRNIVPPIKALMEDGQTVSVPEGAAGLYIRLQTTVPVATKVKLPNGEEIDTVEQTELPITRRQFEAIYHDLAVRTAPQLQAAVQAALANNRRDKNPTLSLAP